jgi:hypothetical protein
MGKPKQPDPAKTAAAQGAWNSFTAQQQQVMNMTGQNSPWGSLEYQQTGTQTIIDPNGKPIQVPMYTANTTLTPEQQAIFDQTQAADLNLAKIANEQSGRVGDLLNDPFTFENSDAEQWAYDLASPRILQQQQKNEGALRSQLIASGIRPGTAAWDSEMSRLTNANTDQLNQLALTGRSQAFNEALAQRNQPLNEIIGLTSGTQIQNPNATFAQTPQSQVAGVDYTGIVNNDYNQQMQQYNAGMGALGGLFGTAITAGFKYSDARLKKDILPMGERNGMPWYGFRYIWESSSSPLHYGFIAQEVQEVMPSAVREDKSGYLMVNYSLALKEAA